MVVGGSGGPRVGAVDLPKYGVAVLQKQPGLTAGSTFLGPLPLFLCLFACSSFI